MPRFRATATVVWEFDTDQDPHAEAVKQIGTLLPNHFTAKLLRVSKKVDKRTKQRNTVLGVFKPEDVLPYLTNDDSRRDYVVGDKTYSVKMNSHRYFVFRTSLECVACGLTGTKFLLEQQKPEDSPHFNLYAEEDGELVLMTKDHIQARSHGGQDRLTNYQTMCCICNNLKGNAPLTIDGVRELRQIYNESRKTITKKNLSKLLDEARKRLETLVPAWKRDLGELQAKAKAEGAVGLIEDLNIYRLGDDCMGLPIHQQEPEGSELVACIKKGAAMIPNGVDHHRLIFDMQGTPVCIHQGLLLPV